MIDILAPNSQSDGQYGTDALESVLDTSKAIYDLAKATYFDDNKFTLDDTFDVALLGPKVVSSVQKTITTADQLDEEITDLSENEKARLRDVAGDLLNDPAFAKIFNGLLNVIDGASEIANAENPRD